MDDALRSFEAVLLTKPTNVVALLGKVVCHRNPVTRTDGLCQARIFYARRNFKEALKIFQDVLRFNPHCIPDPRIGIGLCLWALEHKAKAKAAWQRSMEVVSNRGVFWSLYSTNQLF